MTNKLKNDYIITILVIINTMYVIKRNGQRERMLFDKITSRIQHLIGEHENAHVSAELLAQKTIKSIYSGITTEELDIESANVCINLCTTHHLYAVIAGRILVSNLHKKTLNTFVEKQEFIQRHLSTNKRTFLNEQWLNWIIANKDVLNAAIDYKNDYMYDYFGFKTLEQSYLVRVDQKIVERPQDMLMRTASFINCGSIEDTIKTYKLLSSGQYTQATPTLFNAGTNRSQAASCFLIGVKDTQKSERETWGNISNISRWSGGIGLHISNVRANGAPTRGSSGTSNGIIPYLKVYNEIMRRVCGKRKGNIAVYLEPHHSEILQFLELRKNTGAETARARDLQLALWVSDLFMKQVLNNGKWYLMCPSECPRLNDVYGEEYEQLYWSYVQEGKYQKVVNARDVMDAILDSQIETGSPYMVYKDHVNKKSNQKNIGVIRSSNLCAEIVQYSDDSEYGVCNLASIAVNQFIDPFVQSHPFVIYTKDGCKYCTWAKSYLQHRTLEYNEQVCSYDELKEITGEQTPTYPQIYYGDIHVGGFTELYSFIKGTYNYERLFQTAYVVMENLNKVIDINYYPVIETKRSNIRHRPVGMGIQGVADALVQLRINFESEAAAHFNRCIMETIYLAAMTASCDIAEARHVLLSDVSFDDFHKYYDFPEYYDKNLELPDPHHNQIYHQSRLNRCEVNLQYKGSYSTFEGSPISQGLFQFDLWNYPRDQLMYKEKWGILEQRIKQYGIRNSLSTALMPTASTSQILGNNECFEPFTNNIYTRKTIAGDFPLVNKYLIDDLVALGVWNDHVKQQIISDDGSVASINVIPQVVKNLYKNVWEIDQVWMMKNALARSPFVDQSQSLNIFFASPNTKSLYNAHRWAWEHGMKTGMYYLRSKPATNASKVTVDPSLQRSKTPLGMYTHISASTSTSTSSSTSSWQDEEPCVSCSS